MNKLLPILLVIVLSGCASNFHEVEMQYNINFDNQKEKCMNKTTTMSDYVTCVDNVEAVMLKERWVNNIPYYMSTQDSYRVYNSAEKRRKMLFKYASVIADEVDKGNATRNQGELEIAKIRQVLLDIDIAKFNNQSHQNLQNSLQFLDIYSRAIERTTPQR